MAPVIRLRAAFLLHLALYLLHRFSCALLVRLAIPTNNRAATIGHEQRRKDERSDILRRCLGQGDGIEKGDPNRNIHLLVLPGFFNDSQDYIMEGSLIPSLKSRGFSSDRIHVVPVKRMDWLTVFLFGLLDIQFWKSSMAPTRASYSWYLQRIFDEVDRIVADEINKGGRKEDVKVVMIGHSAGGWLARAAVGFGTTSEWGKEIVLLERVAGLVTLGTPHLPPPNGFMDMTRGALRITNEYFPGAFHSSDGLFYVTVIGNAVSGKQRTKLAPLQQQSIEEYAYVSYEAVCGNGSAVGDGVVPIESAHLNDAVQVELRDVYHSINRPGDWYGSDRIIDQWLPIVLDQLKDKYFISYTQMNNAHKY